MGGWRTDGWTDERVKRKTRMSMKGYRVKGAQYLNGNIISVKCLVSLKRLKLPKNMGHVNTSTMKITCVGAFLTCYTAKRV